MGNLEVCSGRFLSGVPQPTGGWQAVGLRELSTAVTSGGQGGLSEAHPGSRELLQDTCRRAIRHLTDPYESDGRIQLLDRSLLIS